MHPHKTLNLPVVMLASIAACFSVVPTFAANIYWTGSANNYAWGDTENWNTKALPNSSSDTAVFAQNNYAGRPFPNFNAGSFTTLSNVDIGRTANGAEMAMSGAFSLTAARFRIGASNAGVLGSLSISGSAFLNTAGTDFAVGYGGLGVLEMYESGSATTTASLRVASEAGSSGTMILRDNASFTTAHDTYIGRYGTGVLSVSGSSRLYADAATRTLYLGQYGTGTGTLNITERGAVYSLNTIIGNDAGSNGYTSVSGTGLFKIDGFLSVGLLGTGSLSIAESGTVTVSDQLYVAGTSTGATAVNGALRVSGDGRLDVAKDINLAVGKSSNATLTITDNAFVSGSRGYIGSGSFSNATVTVSGTARWENSGNIYIGNYGTGVLVIDEDATVTTKTARIGSAASASGTLHLKGGILIAETVQKGSGAATVNLNGGTVRAAADNTNFFQSLGSNVTINSAGVADGKSAFTFDTAGFDVTLTNNFVWNDTAAGVTFEKNGAGVLTMNAATTYSGSTRINGGMLKAGAANLIGASAGVTIAASSTFDANGFAQSFSNLSGAGNIVATGVALTLANNADTTFDGVMSGMTALSKTGAGALTLSGDHSAFTGIASVGAGTLNLVGTNARLGGTVNLATNTNLGSNGTIGALTAAGNNILTIGAMHGAPAAETLTITGALSLGNNTTLRYDLFLGSYDQLLVGSLTRTGTSTIDLNTALTGSYKLISASGASLAVSDTANLLTTINSGSVGSRTTVSYSILNSNELWLNVISSNIANNKWSGTNTGSWMDNFANWQASDNLFLGGDSVIFDDTAAGTHIVSVDSDVRASDISVDTATNYTFIGNGAISSSTVAPTVAGALGKLTKTGAGTLILANSGSNYFQNGIVLAGGTLQGNARTLGNADIANSAALVFDQADTATYTGAITGGGSLTKINTGTLTLTNAASTYTGGIKVAGGFLELQNSGVTTKSAIDIAGGATLRIAQSASYTVQHALIGNGMLDLSLSTPASDVNFTAAAGTIFAGTLRLGQGTFDLSGQNAAAIQNAALELGAGNTTTIGAGTQTVRNLTLSGAKLVFSATIPPDLAAAGIISTNTLALSTGTIQVTIPTGGGASSSGVSLLAQDDGTAITRLISSTTVTGNVSGLTLVDQTGAVVGAATARSIDIVQGGTTVATGTYNYGLSAEGGLGVSYKLTQININNAQTLTLASDAGATGASAEFTARISGNGNLTIDASNAPVTITGVNTYTGTTSIAGGTFNFGSSDAIGETAALNLAANSTVNLNGYTQAVGALTTETSSTFNLGGGSFKIKANSVVNGGLTGAGLLDIASGSVAINGANSGLTASTTIANNAGVTLNNAAGLGSGKIGFAGANSSLTLNVADSGTMANALAGAANAGQLIKTGAGTVTLTGSNSGYSGAVSVQAGRLVVSGSSAVISGTKPITLGEGAFIEYTSGGAGPITITNRIANTGDTGGLAVSDNTAIVLTQASALANINVTNGSKIYAATSGSNAFGAHTAVSIDATSALVNRQATLNIESLALNGTLWVSDPATVGATGYGNVTIGQKLTSTGTGTIVFRTDLSRGLGDRLTIGAASGAASNYTIIVNNTDTPFNWGVESFNLITSADPQARFTLGNEIATNTGYIYGLNPDGTLSATNSISHEADAVLNTASVMSADWQFELDSLSSRMGEVRREIKALGDQRPGGNVWARANAYHVDADAEIGGYAFSQDAFGMMVGGDKAFRLGKGHVLLGAFAGFSVVDRSFDNHGDGSTDGLAAGIYLTWLHKTGWYFDATAKFNKYENDFTARDTDGSVLSTGSYDNSAYGGSFEFGRYYQGSTGWWIEASAQFAYTLIEESRFTTSTGARIVIFDSEATQYRGSIRWGKIFKDRLSLWMKTALVGTNNDCGEVRFYGSDKTMRADIDGLRMEAGLGLNYALSKRSQLYFDYEYAKADYYTRPWSFNLGYRLFW